MGKAESLVKLVTGNKDCEWIYRFRANPGRPWGRHRAALSGLGPWSALGSRPRVALSSAQVSSVYPGALRLCKSLLLGLGAPPGVGRRQFLLACGPDRFGPTGQLVGRRDIGDRTMQAHRVVMVHELGDQPPSVLQAQRRLDPNALSFQGLEPPLHLAVALGIIWRRSDVSHTAYADKLLEVPGDKLGAVVRDDPGPLAGKPLARPPEDRLHLGFGHGLADLPVDEEPAVAVEDAAQEEECPADINIRDIDMPVLMRPRRLLEALALLGGLSTAARELAGRLEHAVDAGRADGHDIGVEHHVRQPPIAFRGITVVEGDDGGLFPILEPEVARDRGVVLVGRPQALAPAAELAGGDAQPSHQQSNPKAGAATPMPNELDDRITRGLGNP